jgi:hypothetical protein
LARRQAGDCVLARSIGSSRMTRASCRCHGERSLWDDSSTGIRNLAAECSCGDLWQGMGCRKKEQNRQAENEQSLQKFSSDVQYFSCVSSFE